MYAVVANGSHQYKVAEGLKFSVEKLDGEIGSKIVLDKVLLVGGEGELKLGNPFLASATVEAEILEQGKDKKILILKKKRRKGYRKKQGHRQTFTLLKVNKILF
ncbi:MAG: 50S ribosomal protein L21 [Deltaproteobacteria bacterium]|nr:50S ribosomal protein L21 [Deltaproteobacteria bacterium]